MKYTLIIVTVAICLYACKKHDTPPSPKSYTSKMAGTHALAGTEHYIHTIPPGVDTLYNISGNIEINIVNDSTISVSASSIQLYSYFGNNTLYYSPSDDIAKTITFYYKEVNSTYQYHDYKIIYNYLNNSILYNENDYRKWDTYEVSLTSM